MRSLPAELHELLGVLDWEQSQEHLVEQREDCRLRADASASETTATPANTGDLASVRRAKRRPESTSRIFLYTARRGNS